MVELSHTGWFYRSRALRLPALLGLWHVHGGRTSKLLSCSPPDRLARSTRDLLDIVEGLRSRGVEVRILSMNLDTATPTGKLILTALGGVAMFERELMLVRQREEIAKAKAEGKYKGRKPTASAKASEVRSLHDSGIGATEIARRLGIGRTSVYRVLEGFVGNRDCHQLPEHERP